MSKNKDPKHSRPALDSDVPVLSDRGHDLTRLWKEQVGEKRSEFCPHIECPFDAGSCPHGCGA